MGGITGLGSGANVSGIESGLQGIAGNLGGLASTLSGEGGQIYDPSYNQFLAGATGQLTPSQQAAVTQTLNQMNLGTAGRYSDLGLGGSTMEQQDLGANQLSSLGQQQAFEAQSEQLGLEGLGRALGFYGGATNALGTAGQALGGAGNIAENQQQLQLGALSSAASALGGKGAGGGLLGGLFG